MNPLQNYLAVDNPNVPLLSTLQAGNFPIGKFVEPTGIEVDVYDTKELGSLSLQDLYLPNVSIRTYKGSFDRNAVLINKSGFGSDFVGSCFFLEGEMETFSSNKRKVSEIFKGMHNLKYDPNNELSHTCEADKPFHIVHVALATNFFFEILPDDEVWADSLRTKVMKRERVMTNRAAYITIDQYKALQKIIDCEVAGKLGHLMMETYVVQIMLLQLHALFQKKECTLSAKLSKRDQDLMHEVKSYVSQFFLHDHSLASLARHFGTNTSKLMNHFKSVFGTSIFEYINELKMDYAKHLLVDGLTVSQVASKIGYKNPHHFSVAFKKKFGISPSSLKVAA